MQRLNAAPQCSAVLRFVIGLKVDNGKFKHGTTQIQASAGASMQAPCCLPIPVLIIIERYRIIKPNFLLSVALLSIFIVNAAVHQISVNWNRMRCPLPSTPIDLLMHGGQTRELPMITHTIDNSVYLTYCAAADLAITNTVSAIRGNMSRSFA